MEKKTPNEWLETKEFSRVEIVDPDGWNRAAENWQEEWNKPLSHEEFTQKLFNSTIRQRKGTKNGCNV